jgi:ATP-dependent Clp protease ATP-binding subunit ClpC
MTSNVGADMIKRQSAVGFALKREEQLEERITYEDMRKKLIDSLKRVFRPEFINRLDSVIVFRSLNKEDIKKIVLLELDKVSARLEEHEVILAPTQAALDKLAELGFDPDMGARPLRRIIQQKVEDPLSDKMLSGEFEDGDTIAIDVQEDEVVLQRGEGKAAQPAEDAEAVPAA